MQRCRCGRDGITCGAKTKGGGGGGEGTEAGGPGVDADSCYSIFKIFFIERSHEVEWPRRRKKSKDGGRG